MQGSNIHIIHMSGAADCIAVFDWDTPVDLLAWLDSALQNFDKAGLQPDEVFLDSDGKRAKRISVGNLRNALLESPQTCQGIDIYCTRPGYKQLVFGWRMCAQYTTERGRTALLACEAGLLDPFEVSKQMVAIFGPVYGIGFQRPFGKGPSLYAYGMAAGLGYSGTDRDAGDAIGAWMRERRGPSRHKTGMLRDVYPINLITDVHLSQRVDGRSLRQWILEDSARGQLFDASDKQAIWHFADNASIESVRGVLRVNNLLIAA